MDTTVEEKSFRFALRIVKLCRLLQSDPKNIRLADQLLRSGTSVGANISEAQQAQSRADFVSKMSIALKEAAETDYWLRLLHGAQLISEKGFFSILRDCRELERMLTAIIKSSKSSP